MISYGVILKYIIILYYNLMGPPSYMRSVVDRNVFMRRMTVLTAGTACPKCGPTRSEA